MVQSMSIIIIRCLTWLKYLYLCCIFSWIVRTCCAMSQLRGGSQAESSSIQSFDAALGMQHETGQYSVLDYVTIRRVSYIALNYYVTMFSLILVPFRWPLLRFCQVTDIVRVTNVCEVCTSATYMAILICRLRKIIQNDLHNNFKLSPSESFHICSDLGDTMLPENVQESCTDTRKPCISNFRGGAHGCSKNACILKQSA